MLLIITSTDDKLFWGIYLDDFKRSCTPKIRVLVNFSRFPAATQNSKVNCVESARDRTKGLAYKISASNVDFSNLLRFNKACARECQKGIPF